MRNAKGTTPTTKRIGRADGSASASSSIDKTSGKKLKQARLPFKIIAPGSGFSGSTAAAEEETQVSTTVPAAAVCVEETPTCSSGKSARRKRKLSYEEDGAGEEEGNGDEQALRRRSGSKENLVVAAAAAAAKKIKVLSEGDSADVVDDDIVLLDDDDDDDEDERETLKKKKEEEEEKRKVANNARKSPKLSANSRKTSKTPNVSNEIKTKKDAKALENTRSSSKASPIGSSSTSRLQIKLPLSSSKNKRRKSMHKATTNATAAAGADASAAEEEKEEENSADDLEALAVELNPQKRAKLSEKISEQVQKNKANCEEKVSDKVIETIHLESEDDLTEKPTATKDSKETAAEKGTDSDSENPKQKKARLPKERTDETSEVSKEADAKSNNERIVSAPLTDIEADDEAEDNAALDDDNNAASHDSSASSVASVEIVQDTTDNEIPPDHSSASSNARENKVRDEVLKSSQTPTTKSESVLAGEQKKPLTPKQVKLLEHRRRAREDKERKLHEERLQKQREKEDKEQARKREREEKEELRRKERGERDDQKRKEREEKERQRLAESETKNEEKRKRNEAKEEELRKKEDERKRKEQEKEQAEAKKKKAAAAFTKFFVPKKGSGTEAGTAVARDGEQVAAGSLEQESGVVENTAAAATLAFRPFQVKGDMKMAPICRKVFSSEARTKLDSFLPTFSTSCDEDDEAVVRTKPLRRPQLYLGEIRSGTVMTVKWRRPSNDAKVNADGDDDDVLIIEDDLERAGQAIVEETHRPVERLRAKFYKFHENRRPPFFGTWRKKTELITARRPLGQDKKYFDYEIDSDLEWEEEEPGESLDGGSDDDKEKESGDDEEYEVDNEWFVPHGHLSDEEIEQQNEEEGVGGGVGEQDGGCEMGDSNTREAQKAKLKVLQQEFAQEMKKKTEKIKPRLVGCIWADARGLQPELCPNIIWETLQLRAMLPMVAPPLVEEPTLPDCEKTESESTGGGAGSAIDRTADKVRPIALTDRMLQDLIRLVHGNHHSKMFLIKEFIAFIEANEAAVRDGNARGPLKSAVREKIDEYAVWKSIAAAESIGAKKKKKLKKRLCWIVSAEALQRMDLSALDLNKNNWQYTLQPKISTTSLSASANAITTTTTTTEKEYSSTADAQGEKTNERLKEVSPTPPPADTEAKGKRNLEITRFTKVLTADEKAAQLKVTESVQPLQKVTTSASGKTKTRTTPTSSADLKAAVSPSAVKKRVPLLMSVARGAQISTSAKNALISQFLKKPTTNSSENDKNVKPPPKAIPMETEIIVLE